MEERTVINILEVVGSAHCTASEDGQKVYKFIQEALREGKQITLSFKNIEDLTSAFLNAAIGQLYNEFSEQDIKDHITITDASQDDLILLKRVVIRAKEFFKNPDRFKNTVREMLGDDDER